MNIRISRLKLFFFSCLMTLLLIIALIEMTPTSNASSAFSPVTVLPVSVSPDSSHQLSWQQVASCLNAAEAASMIKNLQTLGIQPPYIIKALEVRYGWKKASLGQWMALIDPILKSRENVGKIYDQTWTVCILATIRQDQLQSSN